MIREMVQTMMGVKFEAREVVRIGIIGVGGRTGFLLNDLLRVEHVQIAALCDTRKDRVVRAQQVIEKAGQKPPALYFGSEHAFESLCQRDDVDIVYIATPWESHAPMAVAAMNNGKHVGVEVPAATTLEECWGLVNTSEKTRRHCIMLENCCYGYYEMMVLNMVRAGLLGELVHGEAAYIHDLRHQLFFDYGYESEWRRAAHVTHDGNLYPTHGLGPVAQYMDIHRGDRFDYLVSVSSLPASLAAYREQHVPRTQPEWQEHYRCGDMNTSVIKTVKGRTILLQYSATLPRPYDRINLICGTRGIFRDYPPRLYLDGQAGGEEWTSLDQYKARFEHPLWTNLGERALESGGHDGTDFIMCYRLVQWMREGLAPDMDVYDAAAWSAPWPLSEMSVAQGSRPVEFPDFTRGHWKDRPEEQVVSLAE